MPRPVSETSSCGSHRRPGALTHQRASRGFLLSGLPAFSQATTATLTGTVRDTSAAVVPGAAVMLKNEASGDLRRTTTNSEGYFSIVAIPAGSYVLTVEAS